MYNSFSAFFKMLLFLLPAACFLHFSAPLFGQTAAPFHAVWLTPSATPFIAPKYKKMEVGISLSENVVRHITQFFSDHQTLPSINPYNPHDIDVSVWLTSPSGKKILRHAFYTIPYAFKNGSYTEINSEYPFRFRFAPDETGSWQAEIRILLQQQKTEVGIHSFGFTCVPSEHPGYLVKGSYGDERDRYLYYSETGSTFKGIGMNITHSSYDSHWSEEELKQHKIWLESFAASGGNFVRLEMGAQNALPDWLSYNDYTPRMKHMAYFDEVVDVCEEKELYFILFRHHEELYEDGPNTWNGLSWADNPYKKAFQLDKRIAYFTHPEALVWQKHCLRYIMARWGYSAHFTLYQYSELDNFIPLKEEREKFFSQASFRQQQQSMVQWLKEMAQTVKAENEHVLFNVTFTGNKNHDRLKELFRLPKGRGIDLHEICDVTGYHQYNDEKKETNYRDRYSMAERSWKNFRKPVVCEEIGFFHPASLMLYCCPIPEFKNNVWATFFMGNMSCGMHWWWDRGVFLQQHEKYFSYLSAFLSSEKMEDYRYSPGKWKDNAYDKMLLETFYLVADDKTRALGWVHNASYRWRNLYNTHSCVKNVVDSNPAHTCTCEDGYVMHGNHSASPLYDKNFDYHKYKDFYGDDVQEIENKTFTVSGLKKRFALSAGKHWYRIDFYFTQDVAKEAMYSHSLVLPANNKGEIKPSITLKKNNQDMAYKVQYLATQGKKPEANEKP